MNNLSSGGGMHGELRKEKNELSINKALIFC